MSPHGLRAGFITEAYLAAPDKAVMAHTRHLDHSTMRGYRCRARVTADNPARLMLPRCARPCPASGSRSATDANAVVLLDK